MIDPFGKLIGPALLLGRVQNHLLQSYSLTNLAYVLFERHRGGLKAMEEEKQKQKDQELKELMRNVEGMRLLQFNKLYNRNFTV